MDISRRKDIIVFVLIIILAFLIGNNVVYKFNLNKIDSIKSQIGQDEEKNVILGDIALLDKSVQTYQKRFFSTVEITELLDKISELGKETGIEIENYNPLPAVYRDEYIELSVKIPLRCEYHKLGEFLSLIESNQEFMWVKEVNMQKSTVVDPKKTRIPKIDLIVSGLYLKK